MTEAINNIQSRRIVEGYPVIQASEYSARQKVQQEFMAIFYKELLKQSFKTPTFGLEENNSSFMSTFGSDMLIDKLALELARSQAFSAANVFPSALERSTK
jgi:Rod binding domain-containing protein